MDTPGAMTANLFRREVIEAQAERNVFGTTLVLPPALSTYVLLASCLAAAILILLFFGRYSPKDTVRGYIATTEADVRVFAHSEGTVEAVLVSDGERVDAGQPLLRLGTSRVAARPAGTSEAILAALAAEQQSLAAGIDSTRAAFAARRTAYTGELRALEQRLALLGKQRRSSLEAAGIAERALQRLTRIVPADFVSGRELDDARMKLAEAVLRLRAIELDSDEVRAAIRRNEASLAEHPHLLEREIAAKEAERQQLAARIAEARAVSEQIVSAPAAGIVTGLLVRKGQTVSTNRPLLSLVPARGRFYAELLVPTRSIGFVRAGAAVKIRYDAFPHQKYGVFDGVVDYVARTTTLPGDKAFPMPVAEAVYLARVSVLAQAVPAGRNEQPLVPGMTLTADIERDRRRLIEWLFDPLISAGRRL